MVWRVVEKNGLDAVVLDERDRSAIHIVNGTPCLPPDVAQLLAAALNKRDARARAKADFEGRDPYHGEFY